MTRLDKDVTRKEGGKPISFMNSDTKILTKILVSQIQQYMKEVIHHYLSQENTVSLI